MNQTQLNQTRGMWMDQPSGLFATSIEV